MNKHRTWIGLCLLLCTQTSQAETIYKGKDQAGETLYSDRPLVNGEVIELPSTQSYPSGSHGSKGSIATSNTALQKTEEKPVAIHYTVQITSPGMKETFPQAVSEIPVSLSLDPALAKGDQIQILLNNQVFGSYENTTGIVFSNLVRGAYAVRARVVSASDASQIKGESEVVLFYQQRASRILRPGG